jgi:hypothetical protein
MRELRYTATITDLGVSSQLHAPTALYLAKEAPAPTGGWVGSRAGVNAVVYIEVPCPCPCPVIILSHLGDRHF